ncbi:23S rRNA (guanosine(2251)-2'-O)-methyltransferase RlmB [Thermicanus aegyptius]|uniref:23S rRNA (guanosine(2251)-2'-O)-methyltransferase RlmB n=1 Tax=Thermicanus aegyptius TaxID=94009 RepID=UPI00041031B4|nr:23S rRNA (guanosine(2251)-2'-O)-methyltransferase RlmB [Thermicanus aegyptius]
MNLEEIIYGKNPVIEAIRSGRAINKIWVAEGIKPSAVKGIYEEAKKRGIVIQQVPRSRLDQAAETKNHQGILIFLAAHSYYELDDLLRLTRQMDTPPFFIMLDGIEDPHNLGSILRSADGAGLHGVMIPKRRAAPLTPAVAKSSAGAIEYVPVARITNLSQAIDELKENGFWVIGTDANAKTDYREADYTRPTLLVIGNEGKGISRLVKEKCDFLVKLPMMGKVSSLNASVAAALLMYEGMRQRNPLRR